jgi:drug/metabolite transporter (DMT)-like permease
MRASRINSLAAVVLVVCWSSGFVGATLATRNAPVDTVLAWRSVLAALVLGGWALARGERIGRTDLARQLALGVLVQALYLGGVFGAAGAGVPAGTSALIAALQPLLVAALAGPLLAERTTRPQQLGLLIGAAGVGVVVSGDLDSGSAAPWAYLLPVGALIALAAGTVLERHWSPQQSLVTSLALQSSVAAIVFAVVAALDGHLTPPASGEFWLSIGWLVTLSSLGGYGSYLFIVRRSGATRASTLLYLTPPTTAVWAWLLFGQAPHLLAVPGVVICAVGLTLTLRPVRPRISYLPGSACHDPVHDQTPTRSARRSRGRRRGSRADGLRQRNALAGRRSRSGPPVDERLATGRAVGPRRSAHGRSPLL